MRLRRTPVSSLLPALALAGVAAVLAGFAGTANAMMVLPDAARGACPSCQVDDPEAPLGATTIVISGRGYGHGLGMSQWGAYGMASKGASVEQILRFYYPGTALGPAPVAAVNVLLADAAPVVRIGSAAPFVAVDGGGHRWELPAGEVSVDLSLSLPVGDGGAPVAVAGPIVFRPKSQPLQLAGKPYRGTFRVSIVPPPPSVPRLAAISTPATPATTTPAATTPATTTPATTTPAATTPAPTTPATTTPVTTPTSALPPPGSLPAPGALPATPPATATPVVTGIRVVNTVGLEAYLAGVVPREAPASWPAAALQAQAVAARSYALAHRTPNLDFDLYGDERSQVYGGIAAEAAPATAAVAATAGRVLLYAGKVADTMFSASNGGRTVSAAEAWPGLPGLPPYLVARDDPYDAAASPYAAWGPVVVPAAQVETALGLPGSLVDLSTDSSSSTRPTLVTATTSSGTVDLSPSRVRTALGLRSTWIDVGVLSLARTAAPAATYGSTVTLSGLVRGLDGVQVEQRTVTGWQPLGQAAPDATGRFTIATKALASTDFRLNGGTFAAGPVAGALISVPVVPRVRITQSVDGSGLAGILRPAAVGTQIQLQYDSSGTGATWSPVGTATVAADGSFLASLPVRPQSGSYRAVVQDAAGLVTTTTQPVKVTITS